ncbi:hypothetical protein BCY84_18228 [Trypanosoma cruzi cruzi]|nr:hypothetical protein TcBrA4_0102550 [Trypanosoma cruzi]PBJ70663.1 hypothetical protein BCY84_18228 [Trypanosoma cruzi cruzi]
MTIRVGVSFDLLGTLVDVHRSSGYQYAIDFCRFVEKKGFDSPPVNVDVLEENSKKSLKAEIAKDRAEWTAKNQGVAEEMPFGGVTKESVVKFWCRVVNSTYDREGAFCGHDPKTISIMQQARNSSEWDDFIVSVVQRFATPEPYSWLPETLPTLYSLKRWRELQLPLGIQCDPPRVLTNADYRLVSVVREMVQREGDEELLGPVFSADVVGVGKPSPCGIEVARKAACVPSASQWIHVGDGEADRVAAERAGCHFLPCLQTKGVVWEELREKLEQVCRLAQEAAPCA